MSWLSGLTYLGKLKYQHDATGTRITIDPRDRVHLAKVGLRQASVFIRKPNAYNARAGVSWILRDRNDKQYAELTTNLRVAHELAEAWNTEQAGGAK